MIDRCPISQTLLICLVSGFIFVFLVLPVFSENVDTDTTANSIEVSSGTISLADAVTLALERNPGLSAYSWDIRAAEARQIQAQLRPNPELTFEIEDFRFGHGPGTKTASWTVSGIGIQRERESESGARSGFSEAQFTISLSQIIELGGKRAKRMALAERDRDVTAWDYEIARADLFKEVAQTFVEVLVAQQRVALDEELVHLAQQVLQTVSAGVDAGRVSPLETMKAETALSVARMQADLSRRGLDSLRIRLAALWGDKEAHFERAEGDLDTIRDIPALDELVKRTDKNPDLARWRTELEKRQAAIAVEKANAVPDLTVSAGFRMSGTSDSEIKGFGYGSDGLSRSRASSHSNGNWDNSAVLEFSLPLPLFNRNQGSIKEAVFMVKKAGAEARAADVRVHATLAESYYNLAAALAAITSLNESILPSTKQTFESINQAYNEGKFGYLDVLDAQRTLFDARQQYLDALATYHLNVAEIERAIGESLWDMDIPQPPSEEEK